MFCTAVGGDSPGQGSPFSARVGESILIAMDAKWRRSFRHFDYSFNYFQGFILIFDPVFYLSKNIKC